MSDTLTAVAKVIRDLLPYDEQLIRIGRQNFEQEDFETNYIVIDALGDALLTSSTETFDGTAEELSVGGVWRGPVTLDFYGSGTYNRAAQTALKLKTQTARELKRTYGVTIYHATGLIDLKQLTGQAYGERVQITCQVEISLEFKETILRIDTAQIQIRNEDGVQYDA